MPVCHCALKNLLYSEVNCPEVLVKKLEEGGEWGEVVFSFLLFFFLTVRSEVSNSHDFKRKWGKAFSFELDADLCHAIAKDYIKKMLKAEGIRFVMDSLRKCSVRVSGWVPFDQIKMRSGSALAAVS